MAYLVRRLALFVILLGGCTGTILEPSAGPRDDPRRPDAGDSMSAEAGAGADGDASIPPGCSGLECVAACDGVCIGESGTSRLSRTEYRNSVWDVLRVRVDTTRLPADHLTAGMFESNQSVSLTVDDLDRYSAAAEDVAADVDVPALTRCAMGETPAACGARFVDAYGPRLHRRPLSSEDRSDYVGLLEWSRGAGDSFQDAVRLVVSAMLQSPSFLYRVERVPDETPRALDGYAVAARLSYALWQTTPEPSLLEAAAAGELDDVAGVERQARRMLADPRADAGLRAFHRSWLGISDVDQLSRSDPRFSPELGSAMLAETDAFVVHAFREGGGGLQALLGAEYSIVGSELAAFYDIDLPAGSMPEARSVPHRRGLLTHASVLAANAADSYADPVYRGRFIRTRVLCEAVGSRPDDVDSVVMELSDMIDPSMSEREQLDVLTSRADCQGCHGPMNGPGFAFGMYDSIGRFRTADGTGSAVDAAFDLRGAGSLDGHYADATELTAALASSQRVADCMTTQWMRYAIGRDIREDGTSLLAASRVFEAHDRDLAELVVAITTTDAFRYRRAPAASE